jgi:hypothetical protein
MRLAVILVLAIASPSIARAQRIAVGLEAGAFNYRWAPDESEYSPIVTGLADVRITRVIFARAALSHAWSRQQIVCLDDFSSCPADIADPVSFARVVIGAGIPVGRVLVFANAGSEIMHETKRDQSKAIFVWGGGINVEIGETVEVLTEYLRHRDEDLRIYTGDNWELSAGLKWRVH